MEHILLWLKKWGETPTTLVAIIFSSISLSWNICSSWIYRNRLLVSIDFVPVVMGSLVEFKIIIDLTNLGKNSVFIRGIYAVPKQGKDDNMEVLRGAPFPTREVKSNQMVRIDFNLESWAFSPYKRIEVHTTRGKIYSINKKTLMALEKNILKECPNWLQKKDNLLKQYAKVQKKTN